MEKLVLEITLPTTDYKRLVSIDSFPVSIGRGYANDVIIQDDYVSEKHLELVFSDNQITITDLNSENGIFTNDKERINSEVVIQPGKAIKIGKTSIKFFLPEHQISKTKKLNINKSLINRYKVIITAWSFILINALVAVMINHFNTYREIKFLKLFDSVPLDVMGLVVGAGFWTFIGRLFKKESAFHKQLLYFGMFYLFLSLFPYVKEVVLFNFPTAFWIYFLDNVASLPIISFYLIATLKVSTNFSLKRLYLFIPLIVVAFSIINYSSDYIKSIDYNSKLAYVRTIQPKYLKITKSKSIDDFCKDCETLFEKTDISD